MIQLEINGHPHTINPGTIEELESAITAPVPADHGVCRVVVDGHEMGESQLAQCDLAQVRHVRVESAPLREIAQNAVKETSDWIARICGVLESIANDYRLGRESDASGRLVHVADALQVLVHLLHGLHVHLPVDAQTHPEFGAQFEEAQCDLRDAIDGLAQDLEHNDPVVLADRLGYGLPRCLSRFQDLLKEAGA